MRTSDWMVERIALGDLPKDELEAARRKLLSEPDGAARLSALEASNHEILASHPPEAVAKEVLRRAHLQNVRANAGREAKSPRPRWLGFMLAAPVVAGLIALMLVLAAPPEEAALGPGEGLALSDGDRSKGLVPSLVLQRREATGVQPLSNGDSARPGDVVQLGYVAAGKAYGVILSIDGAGAVTPHLPESGHQSAQLTGPGTQPLPHAYELDAAPAFERFFFVTSDEPFDLSVVVNAAHALAERPDRARTAPLSLPQGLAQESFLLVKDSP